MAWIDLQRNDIHYTDNGAGEPIVLIHGHGSAAACWEPHINALSERYRVFAYDSFDHGFSSNSPRGGATPDRVDELEEFLAKLGIERPIIVGQSMGSITTLRWGIRHPGAARALVACGMGWPLRLPPTSGIAGSLDAQEQIWLGVGTSFTSDWVEQNRKEYDRYIRIRSTATAIEAARHPRPFNFTKPSWDPEDPAVEEGLRNITSPLLLFIGSLEAPAIVSGAQNVHALVPHSRLVVAEGAGHNAYYQQRALLLRSLDELLSDQHTVAEGSFKM